MLTHYRYLAAIIDHGAGLPSPWLHPEMVAPGVPAARLETRHVRLLWSRGVVILSKSAREQFSGVGFPRLCTAFPAAKIRRLRRIWVSTACPQGSQKSAGRVQAELCPPNR
jgi:hypothetical protein